MRRIILNVNFHFGKEIASAAWSPISKAFSLAIRRKIMTSRGNKYANHLKLIHDCDARKRDFLKMLLHSYKFYFSYPISY